jgi:atypical dual specificity phosphatase
MKIIKYKGCIIADINNVPQSYIDAINQEYINKQQERDNNKYHCTIISSSEVPTISDFQEFIIDDDDFFILGLGKCSKENNEAYYLVVYCELFNKIRQQYKLATKDYHVTLGFKFSDIHDVRKSIKNIIMPSNTINEMNLHTIDNIDMLEYIEDNCNIKTEKLRIEWLKVSRKHGQEHIDFLINKNNYLGYAFKYMDSQNIDDLKKSVEVYDHQVHQKYDSESKATNRIIKLLNDDVMKNNLEYRKTLYVFCPSEKKIIQHEMPRNFSWVIPNKIGGISAIRNEYDLKVLKTLGIKKIYYFLEKEYFNEISNDCVEIIYVNCVNTMPPKFEDMKDVLEAETFDEPVLFGCLGGFGRTGTALSCYLCYKGIDGDPMNSEKAITYLRSIRPKSIESVDQMNFVREFSNNLYKDYGKKRYKGDIKFIMLVGLPGAGKTTFCDLFLTNGYNVKILSQDTMGRDNCERSLSSCIKESEITILDRTNCKKQDRKEWLKLAQLNSKNCLCIYLTTPKFICVSRVKNRNNHPTIKKGGGERIINDLDNNFEEPTKVEGFKEIIYLEDSEDIANYLKTWKCEKIRVEENNLFIHKFPRTEHVFNIGGATVDDRILPTDKLEYFLNNDVQITEKVDGAQIGFSLDENFKVIVQNRSHYVNSASHTQFKLLDKWIYDHTEALYQILDKDTILFGEWLYAKHSISYNNLPDYFLAFDLYNKNDKVFYNRKILEEKLKDTNVYAVRIMYEGKINKPQILKMIEKDSDYTSGRVEGIYLKVFEDDYVKYRAKLVRNDFLCGNKHWSKNIIEKNSIINYS